MQLAGVAIVQDLHSGCAQCCVTISVFTATRAAIVQQILAKLSCHTPCSLFPRLHSVAISRCYKSCIYIASDILITSSARPACIYKSSRV